jgi:hypothetical protein
MEPRRPKAAQEYRPGFSVRFGQKAGKLGEARTGSPSLRSFARPAKSAVQVRNRRNSLRFSRDFRHEPRRAAAPASETPHARRSVVHRRVEPGLESWSRHGALCSCWRHSWHCGGEAHDAQAEGLSGSIGKSLETGRSRGHGGVSLNRESRGPSGSVSCVSSVWWFFLMLGRNVESRKAGTETVSSEIRSSGLWENAEGARVTEATESRAETTEAGLG